MCVFIHVFLHYRTATESQVEFFKMLDKKIEEVVRQNLSREWKRSIRG